MSQIKGVHKLHIRNKNPDILSHGANTEVLLDGQPLKGVTFLKLEYKPTKLTKVTIEMYVRAEVEATQEFEQSIKDETPMKIGNSVYVLGKLESVGVAITKKDVLE